jgi:hypothetical protein
VLTRAVAQGEQQLGRDDPLTLRIVASNVRPVQSVRLSTSFKSRKFVTRDQGLWYLRFR